MLMPSPPIVCDVTVRRSPPAAFHLFAEQLDTWWPRAYTWGQAVVEWIGLEPRAGGRCTERGPGGFECDWGHVTGWDPPARLELAWQISPRREPVPDQRQASRVQVEFVARDGGSDVRLLHDFFERHGPDGAPYRDALAAPEGWPLILASYVAAACDAA